MPKRVEEPGVPVTLRVRATVLGMWAERFGESGWRRGMQELVEGAATRGFAERIIAGGTASTSAPGRGDTAGTASESAEIEGPTAGRGAAEKRHRSGKGGRLERARGAMRTASLSAERAMEGTAPRGGAEKASSAERRSATPGVGAEEGAGTAPGRAELPTPPGRLVCGRHGPGCGSYLVLPAACKRTAIPVEEWERRQDHPGEATTMIEAGETAEDGDEGVRESEERPGGEELEG